VIDIKHKIFDPLFPSRCTTPFSKLEIVPAGPEQSVEVLQGKAPAKLGKLLFGCTFLPPHFYNNAIVLSIFKQTGASNNYWIAGARKFNSPLIS